MYGCMLIKYNDILIVWLKVVMKCMDTQHSKTHICMSLTYTHGCIITQFFLQCVNEGMLKYTTLQPFKSEYCIYDTEILRIVSTNMHCINKFFYTCPIHGWQSISTRAIDKDDNVRS